VALLAAALAALAARTGSARLGRPVFALGLLSLAVILLVDLPAGLDTSSQASRFSGTSAVMRDGFYAELAAAAGLMLGGLLLARHRPRAAGAGRRRRPRSDGPRRRRKRFARGQGGLPAGQGKRPPLRA
jgi:hypothetical protein